MFDLSIGVRRFLLLASRFSEKIKERSSKGGLYEASREKRQDTSEEGTFEADGTGKPETAGSEDDPVTDEEVQEGSSPANGPCARREVAEEPGPGYESQEIAAGRSQKRLNTGRAAGKDRQSEDTGQDVEDYGELSSAAAEKGTGSENRDRLQGDGDETVRQRKGHRGSGGDGRCSA